MFRLRNVLPQCKKPGREIMDHVTEKFQSQYSAFLRQTREYSFKPQGVGCSSLDLLLLATVLPLRLRASLCAGEAKWVLSG